MLQWPDLGLSSCATCKGIDTSDAQESDLPDLLTDINLILEGALL